MKPDHNRLYDLVLPGDFTFVNQLTDCMLLYMNNALRADTTMEAERWLEEFNRCANEFIELRRVKEDDVSKSYHVVVKQFQANGIKASLVSRRK